MTMRSTDSATLNKVRHRARQLRQMAGDLRQMPASGLRFKIAASQLERLAGFMAGEDQQPPATARPGGPRSLGP